MLKLTLKPGEYLDIGEDIRIVFSGGSANNIHLLVDAPRKYNIVRSRAKTESGQSEYYPEQPISEEVRREIVQLLRKEKQSASEQPQAKQIYTVNHKR